MKLQLYLAAIAVCLSSCGQHALKHANLLMIDDQSGDTIKETDMLSVTYTETTEDGRILNTSSEYDDRPKLFFEEHPYFKDDFFSMMRFLSEGDSARFKVSVDSVRLKMHRNLPADVRGKYLVCNVRVNKVLTRGKLTDMGYDSTVEAYRSQFLLNEKKREPAKIASYIAKHHLTLQKAPSGFMYRVIAPGNGQPAKFGDSVVVNYTAQTLTGKVFETTEARVAQQNNIYRAANSYKPYGERLVYDKQLPAFRQALTMFPKGAKVMLLIPSRLGYNDQQYKHLEPYTPLVCSLEILDIIRH